MDDLDELIEEIDKMDHLDREKIKELVNESIKKISPLLPLSLCVQNIPGLTLLAARPEASSIFLLSSTPLATPHSNGPSCLVSLDSEH